MSRNLTIPPDLPGPREPRPETVAVVAFVQLLFGVLFVVLAIFYLKPDVFMSNLWRGASGEGLFQQVSATMLAVAPERRYWLRISPVAGSRWRVLWRNVRAALFRRGRRRRRGGAGHG